MRSIVAAAITVATLMGGAASAQTPGQVLDRIERHPKIDMIEVMDDLTKTERRNVLCMALAIYHEARGSTNEDRFAVGHVVRNRAADGDICKIVFEKNRSGVPQFGWSARPIDRIMPWERDSWEMAQTKAFRVIYDDSMGDPTDGATHFWHRRAARPEWARRTSHEVTLGSHRFAVLAGDRR